MKPINRKQAIFLWIVGVMAILASLGQAIDAFSERSAWPTLLLGVVSIFIALSYRKPEANR